MTEPPDYASPPRAKPLTNRPAAVSSGCAALAIALQVSLCAGTAARGDGVFGRWQWWQWYAIAAASAAAVATGAWGEFRGRRLGTGRSRASSGLTVGLVLGALAAFFIYWHRTGYGAGS